MAFFFFSGHPFIWHTTVLCMCMGVCMVPGCCMSPAYVGVCVAGSSVGKGVTEEEGRKRVCACMWCLRVCCVEVCVKDVHKSEGG